jgi:uncharacterized Zn finger protein
MPKLTSTWWGERFLEALEAATDAGRLQRGRAYAGPSRLLEFHIEGAKIRAKVRGNKNPYFGVYKEPKYQLSIQLQAIPAAAWKGIVARLAANAGWLSRLLLGEVPEDIETAFRAAGHALLPYQAKDLTSQCSCPDYAKPCKHVAGTYYHVAELIEQDPFLLFQLRGLSREALHRELVKTPLGQALSAQLKADDQPPMPEPRPQRYPAAPLSPGEPMDLHAFWHGGPLPESPPEPPPAIPALLLRRAGDRPAFWRRDNSFIEAMSEVYRIVEGKNRDRL